MVYAPGRAPISPEEHCLWPGIPWAMPYPEFGGTMAESFPPGAQHSAQEYLEYAPCLLSRAESFLPVGDAHRPEGGCTSCGSTYRPMPFHLFYAIAPLSREMGGDLAMREFSGRGVLDATIPAWAQGPARCLAGLDSGAICAEPILRGPESGDFEARAVLADVIAFCIGRNAEGVKMHNQLASDPHLQCAGFLWDFVSAAQHIGRIVAPGRYVAITRSDGGGFARFSDGEVVRIEPEDEACRSIGREPVVILFEKRAPAPSAD